MRCERVIVVPLLLRNAIEEPWSVISVNRWRSFRQTYKYSITWPIPKWRRTAENKSRSSKSVGMPHAESWSWASKQGCHATSNTPIGLTGRALPPRGPPVQPKPQLRISRTYQDIGTRVVPKEGAAGRQTSTNGLIGACTSTSNWQRIFSPSATEVAATFPMDAFPKTMSGAAMQAILNDTFNCEKPASNLDKLSYLIYGIPRVTLSTYI